MIHIADPDLLRACYLSGQMSEAQWQEHIHLGHVAEEGASQPGKTVDRLKAEIVRLRKGLEFYANPVIYKPHPHGPAFDNRDLSYHARSVLEKANG